MTIRRALRLSTLLSCMVASLFYAKAQNASGTANAATNVSVVAPPSANTDTKPDTKNIRFQFDGVPYKTVVERFAQMAGKPLLVDIDLEGTLRYSDPEPYDYQEALDTLNLILSMKDATLVEQDRYLRLLPLSKLKQTPLKILRNLEEKGDVRPGEIVTVALNFKNLDPNEIAQSTTTMLSNAGSIFPMGRGKGILVTDRIENIERIEKLLTLADVAPQAARQMRTFNIVSASGPVLTDLINRTFGIATAPVRSRYNQEKNSYMPLPPSPEDYVTAVWDEASRTMVVFGPTERVDLAEQLINRFESKEGVAPTDVRIFYPVEMSATELATMIRQTVTGVANPGEPPASAATKARLVVDTRLNRLIVTTPVAGQMETIQKVIEKVDSSSLGNDAAGSSDMRIYYPKFTKPTELAGFIRQSVSGIATPDERISNKARLVVDEKQGRLLVISGDPEQLAIIDKVVQKLDTDGERPEIVTDTKIFYPRQMSPDELATMVRQMVNGVAAQGENDPQKAKMIVDPKLNRLVVMSANQKLLSEIQSAVDTIDTAGTDDKDWTENENTIGKSELRVYYPQYVTPKELSDFLNQAVSGIAAPGEKASNRARLIVDTKLNRLLVISGDPEQLTIIDKAVKKLDTAGERPQLEMDTKIFYPRRMTPEELATMVRQMVNGIAAQGENDPQKAKLIVDPKLERLVVMSANQKLMGEIQAAIDKVDAYETGTNEQPENGEDQANLEKNETCVVRLEYAVAAELGNLIQTTFNDRRSGLRVLTDERSNSLVLNGKAGVLKAVREVIKDLDVESSSVTGRQIRFIDVQGDPQHISNLAMQLLMEQNRSEWAGKSIQERRRQMQQRADAPRIIPEPYTGRVIVCGTDEEQERIKKIIDELDLQTGGSTGVKVFPLHSHTLGTDSNPYEFASVIRNYLNTYKGKRRGGPQPSVFVDGHSNSLVVCGSASDIQQAATLIETLDVDQEREPRIVKVFNVRTREYSAFRELNTNLMTLYREHLKSNPELGSVNAVFLPSYEDSKLTISASESQMKVIEDLFTLLHGTVAKADKEFRQFKIKDGDLGMVSGLLRMALNQQRGRFRERPWIDEDWSNHKIYVYASPEDLETAEKLINDFDAVGAGSNREIRVFNTKVYDVWDFSDNVRRLYTDQVKSSKGKGGIDAQFIPDYTGRLFVSADQSQMPMIEKIVETLDQERTIESSLRIFRLKQADVRNIYPVVQHVTYNREGPRSRGVRPLVTMDVNRNAIIFYGKNSDLEQVQMIIEKLDTAELQQEREMKTYRITSRNVNEQMNRIRTLYMDQIKAKPDMGVADAVFLPDNENGRMMVAASKEQLELIDSIINSMEDKSALPDMQLHLLKLKHGNNVEIANALGYVVRSRRAQRPGYAPWIAPETKTGGIYVFGLAEDIEYAEQLIKEFDSMSDGMQRILCTYEIQHANMTLFANNVRALYQDQMKDKGGAGVADAYIFGDDYSGKLIVGIRESQKEMLDEIVKTFKEKSEAAEPAVKTFIVKSVRPSQLAAVLNSVVLSKASRTSIATRIIPDDQNNKVVISGNTGEVERVSKLIEELDVPEVRDARQLKMFDVKTWDVWSYSQRVQQLYRDQVKGLTDAGPADALILPDDYSGRLIVASSEKQMDLIENIMKTLEAELPERQLEMRTYKLENIYVSQAVRTVNTLMDGAGMRRYGWGGGRNNREALSITSDEKNNSLIVMGSPSRLALLENILKAIDQKPEKPDREVRFYTLVNADALDVELRLDELFNDKNRPEEAIFESDLLSNTLTVVAREKDFEEIESMIEKMDNVARDLTEIVRLIPITTMPVDQIAEILVNIYPQVSPSELEIVDKLPPRSHDSNVGKNGFKVQTQEERDAQKAAEAEVRPEDLKITLAVDTKANTLLVSGPSFEVDRIRSLISQLQGSFNKGDSEIRMFKLKEADPVLLARTLTELFRNPSANGTNAQAERRRNQQNGAGQQQQGQPPGAQQRPPEGGQPGGLPPVPRAIIVPETRTHSLLIRTSQADFFVIESLIKQLDEEGLDSLLECKVIEVKNANPNQLLRIVNQAVTQLQTVRPGDVVAATADMRTRSICVIARDTMMKRIEQIIAQLDVETDTAEMDVKVYPLKYVSGAQMGVLLQNMFNANAVTFRPGIGMQQSPVQRLKLKKETGEDVSLDLNQPIRVINDTTSAGINRVIVAVPKVNIEALDELVHQLDRELPADMNGVRIVNLKNAEASVLVASLQRLMNERVRRGQTEEIRSVVMADTRSNSLILGGSNANMQLMEDLARELDSAESALMNNIRMIPLEHATAQRLGTTLTTLFQRRAMTGGARNRAVIMPDARSNSLLVAASDEDNRLVDELLKKLDQPLDNPNLEPEVLVLTQNDSTRLAATIRNVFAARLQALSQAGVQPDPQDRVSVDADILSNSLIVTASKENLQVVRDLVSKLDQEPTAAGMIETLHLNHADVQRVATMLRTLVQQGVYRPGSSSMGRRGGGREAFSVIPDIPSNSLIISASPENMALAKELVSEVDTPENQALIDVKTYPLKHARVGTLVTTLNSFFQSKSTAETRAGVRERAMPVTIAADERSNVLLVTAGKEDAELLEKMLVELDVKDANSRMNFNIYPLTNATASKMQMTLQRLFQNRPARARGTPADPITIVADAWANALIIGTSPDDEEMVQSLIAKLDKPESDALKVHVFPMAHADARRVATTVQALLRGQQGGFGFGGAAGPTVSADERINAIIVSAGESDIKRLEELIQKLDTEQVARINEIRIFPLTFARAAELSTILNSVLNTNPRNLTETSTARQSLLQFITQTPDGENLVSSALKEGILITPDPRSNSLVVSAPVDYMEFLDSMIKRMDQSSPQEAKIQIFSLKNADARQMAQVLTALFRLQAAGGAAAQRSVEYTLVKPMSDAIKEMNEAEGVSTESDAKSKAVVGSAEQYALTVTIDLRTNTVLVGGTDHYVSLASDIITTLDAHPAQERTAKVYRLRNSRAQEMETAMRTFLQQDLNRTISILGQSAAGAAQTILDREVSIVAETVSNALLISASPRYIKEVEALIEELDQPQPQVLIQVVLAEVTLDSTTELGVEWKYVDSAGGTPFSVGTDLGVEDALKSAGGFGAAVSGSKVNFLLRALQEDGRLEVLSCPQILTADNVEANINIGERIPIITDTQYNSLGNPISTYAYQDVGVMLTVTPRISPDGTVKMDVNPEVSQLTSNEIQISRDVSIPIIAQRTANTTVSVQSGESVLIGGLISTVDDSRTKKVPWIGNIPVLGALFRSKKFESDRKELLIVLTPQVVMPSKLTTTNIVDIMDMTKDGFKDSILESDLNRDPLQQKVLKKVLPEQDTDTNAVGDGSEEKKESQKTIKRKNYTKELLIDP